MDARGLTTYRSAGRRLSRGCLCPPRPSTAMQSSTNAVPRPTPPPPRPLPFCRSFQLGGEGEGRGTRGKERRRKTSTFRPHLALLSSRAWVRGGTARQPPPPRPRGLQWPCTLLTPSYLPRAVCHASPRRSSDRATSRRRRRRACPRARPSPPCLPPSLAGALSSPLPILDLLSRQMTLPPVSGYLCPNPTHDG